MTVAAFMQATPRPVSGNNAWAATYANEIKRTIIAAAERAPRSLQVHLGPSELGVTCDRQVAGKLVQMQRTNHVVDPWPSVVGTAVHAWLADTFDSENDRLGYVRWLTERRVVPWEGHSGTADLYDAVRRTLVDWKCLGPTTLNKVRSSDGPPRHYRVQMLLYARGYRKLGLPVDRVALVALPRTESTLDSMYVYSHDCTAEDDDLLNTVWAETVRRKDYAELLRQGLISFRDIPAAADSETCYFCPFFRPAAARDPNEPGCPGHQHAVA